MLAPIVAIKHYVNVENATIAAAAIRTVVLVNATTQTGVTNAADVVEGSIIKAVFMEHWIKSIATAGNFAKFQMAIEKVVANQTSITFAQMNNLMAYENKKNIFYFTQGVIGDDTTQGVPIFKDWMMIPKGKQRFGIGDSLVMTISATSVSLKSCGVTTFKEYK